MSQLLFNRESLKVVGTNRPPLPYEISISDVPDTSNLQKHITYTEKIQKTKEVEMENGEVVSLPLFYLPQYSIEIVEQITKMIETTEITGNPVMEITTQKVPLLDENDEQITYEQTVRGKTTEITDEPVLIPVEDENGDITYEQEKDENENLLYWGQIGTGKIIPCFVTEEIEQQKVDENKNPLFYKEVTEEITKLEVQPSLEIDENHELFAEGLEPVKEEVERSKTVNFHEAMYEFTYKEIVLHKYLNLINDNPKYERVIVEVFSDTSKVDYEYEDNKFNSGFGFINLPKDGQVKLTYPLSESKYKFGLLEVDKDDGVDIYLNGELIEDEIVLDSDVDEIDIVVVNTSDKSRDIRSFAIGC